MHDLAALEDHELLAKSRECPAAFGEFYRRHADRVLGYFAVRTSDPELAADLMAETFAAAYVSAHRFRDRGSPPVAWLFVIARSKLVDSVRRGRVQDIARRRLSLEPLELDDFDLARVHDAEARFSADQLLAGLPEREAHAVRARVLDGRDYRDIAGELRCSPGLVRKRVSRGLNRLKTQVEN